MSNLTIKKKGRKKCDALLIQELSCCDCDRPVCRVDQVVDALAVLGGQHLICTTAETNTQCY